MSIKTRDKKGLESGIALLSGESVSQKGVLPLDRSVSFSFSSGLLSDAIHLLGLDRSLKGRNQLQLISWALIGETANPFVGPHTFCHTRWNHSLLAAAIFQLIGAKVRVGERELVVGQLAALLHDMWLLSGGDSWKSANQQKAMAGQLSMCDEDDGFMQKMLQLNGKEWRKLCKRHGLNAHVTLKEVQSIVWGNGLRGQIQEIADTASYMLGDLAEISRIANRHGVENFGKILSFANDNPWDIWHYTHLVDDKVVVLKPEVLENFLWLRALLWGGVYNTPATKFLELLMHKVVYPYLVEEGMVDLKGLLKQDDAWLWNIVEDVFGWPSDAVFNLDLLGGWPMRREFDFKKDLLECENELRAKGCFTLVVDPGDFQISKSKTDKYNVLDRYGKAVPYSLGFPVQSAVLEESFKKRVNYHRFQLYWVENPQNITPQFEKAWARAVHRWHSEQE
ncbi:MAG: hypothetical protein A2534_00825 [Candidatus Magasanikbacteria bacterium RIFOXYD2_FULL_39_9]|uniref:HD/PDEase domain-containing protein n=1 Tax=Candidatus Magasanikbacteria bacterium RIFOXYD1_FULL_40_23 TaxID=1798705 RepID=A0A1F6PB40_9BACT|nr:MAG: hypothetical protein A2534_00825 [Candidatus Magasanikbacteria bacterium RIFOXYD2_FULL_39_9]OGH93387.1 MAG: hypothetical protein A2563_02140 [Candidatus Magasanikbacteria bacterium RIFOXYD1_FULL_40_23]